MNRLALSPELSIPLSASPDTQTYGVLAKRAATIEKAKADDPRELRRQIAELKGQLTAEQKKFQTGTKTVPAPKRVEVLTDADRARLGKLTEAILGLQGTVHHTFVDALNQFEQRMIIATGRALPDLKAAFGVHQKNFAAEMEKPSVRKLLDKLAAVTPQPHTHATTQRGVAGDGRPTPLRAERDRLPHDPDRGVRPSARTARPAAGIPSSNGDLKLGVVHRAFLTVLANRQGKTTRRNQLAVFSGYSAKSRHVDNTISALRSAGLVEGSSHALLISDDGLLALGDWDVLPTGRALIDYWIREVGVAPGAMLKVLVEAYPGTLTRDGVAEASNYSVTSRHVDNSLSYLRTLELITGDRGALSASSELFG